MADNTKIIEKMRTETVYMYDSYEHAALRTEPGGKMFLKIIEDEDGPSEEKPIKPPLPKPALEIIRDGEEITEEQYRAL